MERKLENELPVKGKKYKRIIGGSTVYNKGYTYICEEDCKLKNILWLNKDSFSQLFVEVIEEDKTMERKLEKNERPRKGKKYKFIGLRDEEYYKPNQIYFCETDGFITSELLGESFIWCKDFSDNFVEIVEEDKTKPISYENPWYKKMEEEITAERGYNRTLSKPLTMEEVKHLKELEENSETRFLFPETTGVKHDQDKLPLFTIIFKQFPLAIQAVAKRALAGHNKYIETDADWQNFARAGEQDPDRYKNAGLRHLLEEGEDTEKGMEGTTHEAAVVWNFLADLELKIRRNEKLSK